MKTVAERQNHAGNFNTLELVVPADYALELWNRVKFLSDERDMTINACNIVCQERDSLRHQLDIVGQQLETAKKENDVLQYWYEKIDDTEAQIEIGKLRQQLDEAKLEIKDWRDDRQKTIAELSQQLEEANKQLHELNHGKWKALERACYELDGDTPHQPQACGILGKPLCYIHDALSQPPSTALNNWVEFVKEAQRLSPLRSDLTLEDQLADLKAKATRLFDI